MIQSKCLLCGGIIHDSKQIRRFCGCRKDTRTTPHYHYSKYIAWHRLYFQNPIYQYRRLQHSEHLAFEMRPLETKKYIYNNGHRKGNN